MNNKTPYPQKENRGKDIDLYPACSSGDCTGLIPAGVEDEDELEAYKEMYNFTNPYKDDVL